MIKEFLYKAILIKSKEGSWLLIHKRNISFNPNISFLLNMIPGISIRYTASVDGITATYKNIIKYSYLIMESRRVYSTLHTGYSCWVISAGNMGNANVDKSVWIKNILIIIIFWFLFYGFVSNRVFISMLVGMILNHMGCRIGLILMSWALF